MKCPNCTETPPVTTDRQGVEIDYCPQCRGVWLDRGELDRRIERFGAAVAAPSGSASSWSYPGFADSDRGDTHDEGESIVLAAAVEHWGLHHEMLRPLNPDLLARTRK